MPLRKIIALDESVIARCQVAADKAWDAYGVTVGDVVCAYAVVNGAVMFQLDRPGLAAIPFVLTVFVLAMGSLHSWAQRAGHHEAINMSAEAQRKACPDIRLMSMAVLCLTLVAPTFANVAFGFLLAATFLPLMLYGGTVKVRPRAPRRHPSLAEQR